MAKTLESSFEELAERFAQAFPVRLASPRTVGREAEFPVVDAGGAAMDVQSLWSGLQQFTPSLKPKFDAVTQDLIVGLEGPDFSYALEVGRGTLEINTRPCAHLFELEQLHSEALRCLILVAHGLGGRVLGLGMQPQSPPGPGLMSPKQRYRAMFEIMGEDWLWYTVTASDQLHVDVARPEMISQLNLGLLLTPVVIALCANSSIYAGGIGDFCSTREGIVTQRGRYANRHGMPERAYLDTTDFVTRLSDLPYLLRRHGPHLLPDGRPFRDIVREDGPDFDAFLLHDHYVWHSARLRTAHATLELRPACQQPPHQQMAAAALYLGIVEAADALQRYLNDSLAEESWARMGRYHVQSAQHGLAAPEPAPNFLVSVMKLVEDALIHRGYGEEILLQPLWQRLEMGQNPAQQARILFAQQGLDAVIHHYAFPIPTVD